MMRSDDSLDMHYPGVDKDTAAKLEQFLSSFLPIDAPDDGDDSKQGDALLRPPFVDTAFHNKSNFVETSRRNFSDDHSVQPDIEYAYSILVETFDVIKEACTDAKKAGTNGWLRSLTLAVRVHLCEEKNLSLLDRLEDVAKSCQVWKSRALDAENQLERLSSAIALLDAGVPGIASWMGSGEGECG